MEIIINDKDVILIDNAIVKINSRSTRIEIIERGFDLEIGKSQIVDEKTIYAGTKYFKTEMFEDINNKKRVILSFY